MGLRPAGQEGVGVRLRPGGGGGREQGAVQAGAEGVGFGHAAEGIGGRFSHPSVHQVPVSAPAQTTIRRMVITQMPHPSGAKEPTTR
ncbi:hypothetical protein GCM10010289_48010 [Streptomyces violascens]|uniref:Uncharacterized protein n=1 Tax=Streptomyces violascens TaxID=67381 RepID=A0ABQ3QQH2_9ACTN|nr:hypothetical protein GCM10010289_48010 [Streptomyces violascens]GHI39520.1 hypothetical protein Sviol_39280 [Streptomyces violascens]